MGNEKLYSIGQAGKICDVSARMLRYYEEIGLIQPDRIDGSSHYRYYGIDTLRKVQTIRYFIDEGFSLSDVAGIMAGDDMEALCDAFSVRMKETEEQIDFYHQRLDSLRAWRDLILEGVPVLKHRLTDVSVRYIPREPYFHYEADILPGSDASAYIETEYYTQSKRNGHSMIDVGGAFNLVYDSFQDRIAGRSRRLSILQVAFPNSRSREQVIDFGGFSAVRAYHIGSPERVSLTYEKLLNWAGEHDYRLRGDCFERQVLDIYSTRSVENYVTEILLPVEDD